MTHYLIHFVVAGFAGLLVFLFSLLSLLLHFAPSLYAFRRNVKHRWWIFVLNLLFGWTLLGWFAVAVWAYFDEPVPTYPRPRY